MQTCKLTNTLQHLEGLGVVPPQSERLKPQGETGSLAADLKKCFKCHQAKPRSEFYKHPQMGDGLLGKCKKCTCEDVRLREQRLGQNPEWLKSERARHRAKQLRYRKLGLASPRSKESGIAWDRKNKHKKTAQQLAQSAQDKGILIKPEKCEVCLKETERLEKHHSDYSKPLSVQWLCTSCHGKTRWK